MATAISKPDPAKAPLPFSNRVVPVNSASPEFDPARDLPEGFLEFLAPLHGALTLRQRALLARRDYALAEAHAGKLPDYLPPSVATTNSWRIELPAWCADQRNQMTGPADDADLVVKMLNSGAPGVMLDLEDSTANTWEHNSRGIKSILEALAGRLTYFDRKRDKTVGINPSSTVIFTRPRGLHLHQAGVLPGELLPASLFDVAMVAFQMEEFAWNLRDHILGLDLGRWDYMASLIHFNLENPEWVLPDRNTIPHNVAFFQNLRNLLPEICHKHGMLAIGGMTALYPRREDAELNARALKVLAEDKKNEANSLMDGAWTGHPDQNEIAVRQFPAPNQLQARPANASTHPDLRPLPTGVGKRTLAGTRAAVRTVIRYRNGVLNGKGASLLDGYMEDLATDRIYRLMISQRMKHSDKVAVLDEGGVPVLHTPELIRDLFDEELDRLLRESAKSNDAQVAATLREARGISEEMIRRAEFNPA